ncbi:hypothetical protein V8D89_002650 [Ganoderma adspersum]
MSSSPTMLYAGNRYNSNKSLPLDLLGGLEVNSRESEFDPGDPGPLPHPFLVPPSAFDTRNIQALNALKAHVEKLADLSSNPFSQSAQTGFDPGPASPDSASPASSPSVYNLASPTSSMSSRVSVQVTSPESLLPSPTSSTFPSRSPESPFGGPPSAYSPQEYRWQPSRVRCPSPFPYLYQEGYESFPTSSPPLFGPAGGAHVSASTLLPPAMLPESAALGAARPYAASPSIPPVFPGSSQPRADPLLPHFPPHVDTTQNSLQGETRVQAICEFCGQVFKHKRNLKPHIREKHGPNCPRHRCPYPGCKASYLRPSDLRNHTTHKHLTPPSPS